MDYFYTQLKTDSSGLVYATIEDGVDYKVVLTKDGYVRSEDYILGSEFSHSYQMAKDVQSYSGFQYSDFSYRLFGDHTDSSFNISQFYCEYIDSQLMINSVTCTLTRSNDVSFSQTLSSTNSFYDKLTFNIPTTNEYKEYLLTMTVVRDGKSQIFTQRIDMLGLNDSTSNPEYKLFEFFNGSNYNETQAQSDSNYFSYDISYIIPFIILGVLLIFLIAGSYIGGYVGGLLGGIVAFFILINIGLLSTILGTIFILLFVGSLGVKLLAGGGY